MASSTSWASAWQDAAEKAKQMATAMQTGLDWETAAAKAREVATQLQENGTKVASQTTKITQQLSETTKQKLHEFKLNETIVSIEDKLNDLHKKIDTEAKAELVGDEELTAFGITPEFRDFVRNLNYSTFRDFPDEELLSLEHEDDTPGEHTQRLTPWQARHAALVVQSVKEINELRFVLCPRRMTDDRFWTVYFTLAKQHLPRAAYNRDTPVPAFAKPKAPAAAPLTVDTVAERLRTTFQGFGIPRLVAAPPPPMVTPAAEPAPPPAQRSMLEYDPDLEEYLKVAEAPLPGGESSAGEDGDESDLDLDGYFTQLQEGAEEEGGAEGVEEDDVDDLDDALAEMLKSDDDDADDA